MGSLRQTRPASVRLARDGHVVEREGGPVVRFSRACTACQGCSSFSGTRELPVTGLSATEPLMPGDAVTLTVPVAALTRVAGVLFGAPLAALLAGAWLGTLLAPPLGLGADLTSGLVGLGLLVAASLVVGRYGRTMTAMLDLKVRRRRDV